MPSMRTILPAPLLLLAMMIIPPGMLLAQKAQIDTVRKIVPPPEQPDLVFQNQITVPVIYRSSGISGDGFSGGVEYHRFASARAHDGHHRSLFSESAGSPSSSIDISVIYGPNTELGIQNTGYSVSAGGVVLLHPELAIGIAGSYTQSDQSGTNEPAINDYMVGPRASFWPGDRTYIDDQILFERTDSYTNDARTFAFSKEEFLRFQHHLSYIASEGWDFTYRHEIDVRVGIHQNFHTNSFTMRNYFIFSVGSEFAVGPQGGFSLDYTVGNRTSVLTIPIGARGEYSFGAHSVLAAELGYDVATSTERPASELRLGGGFSYRF
ncbi:MAG: hypothetical protein JWQ98_3201 [Chlorobi bacterium]|nr:hypothetical protein [Chlorobiota bacterium]